jgi:hypothetical protein
MVSHYTIQLAKLGGYLARKGDLPPGNIVLGMQLAAKVVGS